MTHYHFIGIGGTGLSAIARVLMEQGYTISGSDRSGGPLADALARDGATVRIGHDAANIEGADVVVISSAVGGDNPEIAAARARGIPVVKRSDMIAEVMVGQTVIAVAGTHGKTTTTSMIAHILIEAGRNPGYIIGGTLRSTGTNAAAGAGKVFVIEADEYDNMFHGLRPNVAVVTNVEWDHPDFFPTPAVLTDSFDRFVALLPEGGLLIACADDAGSRLLSDARRESQLPALTYGVSEDAEWRAQTISTDGNTTVFDVLRGGSLLGQARLQIPGLHNVANALAAFAAADSQGVSFADAAKALSSFSGAGRRFDLRGEVGGVGVIDDYAHHPTAIRATLQAARQRYPDRAIWAVWQPHTYTRTQALLSDYATAFADADHVLVTDVYAAREKPLPGVTGEAVVAQFRHPDARLTPTLADAADVLANEVAAPAVIVIMSAGDAPWIGQEFLRRRTARE
jgi:UDP-N-acetylmuramate--alanine ligase